MKGVDVAIVEGPLERVPSPLVEGAGAVMCFEGIIRPSEAGRFIEAIEYEAYRPMADRVLAELAEEVSRRFGLLYVCARHSVGVVCVGEVSFRLDIASAHRVEGLEAMAWFIDRMKRDMPIWKHPRFARSSERVST